MAKAGIDVLVLPANHSRWDQMMADSRYLTTIGGFATETLTVFPAEGEVTAGVYNRSAWWKRAQNWVADVRDCQNRWAKLVIDRLHELNFPATGRIGISGLGALARAPDGIVPYGTVTGIKKAFPSATIVDATELMSDLRAVKSPVEVEIMRESVAIIEAMIDAMASEAKPGVHEKKLYATLVNTLLCSGGELPSLMIFGSGPGVGSGQFVPTERVLQAGDMIVGETQASYCGYSGQLVQPISLGRQPDAYMDQFKVAVASLEGIRERMRAGATMGEVMDAYEQIVQREGRGRYQFSHPMMHARGLGDERPAQFGDIDLAAFRRIELVDGMVFVVKPRARSQEAKRAAQIGETVVVTPKGGERLGRRPLELRIV